MRAEVTEKLLNAKITTNVRQESMKVLRLTPLFIKNIAMKLTFYAVGDRKSSTSLSNLGLVKLPDEMAKHVTRMVLHTGAAVAQPRGVRCPHLQRRSDAELHTHPSRRTGWNASSSVILSNWVCR